MAGFTRVRIANALAATTAFLWTLCAVFVWLLPSLSLTIVEWWMHGMSLEVMGEWNLTVTNFVLGGLTLTVSAWLGGWVFGWVWKKMGKS